MCDNCGIDNCSCNPILVERGPQGPVGATGPQGSAGDNGWSESLVLIQNDGTTTGTGQRYSLKFNGWVGGTGTPPSSPTAPNIYLQANGTFGALSSAADLRGVQGNSVRWLGTFATPPVSPSVNDAYRDSALKMARIWDGTAWREMVEDGLAGSAGTPGAPGKSIAWQGTFAGPPPGTAQLNWAYRDTTYAPPQSLVWNGSSWQEMNQDGIDGTDGVNGFNYETVDGNGIPAEAMGNPYSFLIRRPDDTGYVFINFSQVRADLNAPLDFQQF